MFKVLAIAVSLSASGLAGAAFASDAGRPDTPKRATSVEIAVSGYVRSSCQLPVINDVDLGDLTEGPQTIRFDFPLACNTPFELDVRSGGALAHQVSPEGQGGFAGTLGYALDISLPLRGSATTRVAHRSFPSAQLAGAGATISTGDDISAGDGSITLSVSQAPPDGLLAGRYGDTITMVLRPGL
jgi:hypothetical protein